MKNKIEIGDRVELRRLAAELIGTGPYQVTGKKLSEHYIKGQNSKFEYEIKGRWVNGVWIK